MENKTEKVHSYDEIHTYSLKYVGFGEVIFYDFVGSSKYSLRVHKGYEITGIYKKIGFGQRLLKISQLKKEFQHGIFVEFYEIYDLDF